MHLSTENTIKNLKSSSERLVHMEGETLKHYQRIILSIAEDVIKVCDEEKISYHLTGGTALGAVRHQGFIPWDDDLDIDILGSDFDRFIDVFTKEYNDKYWIHTYNSPDYGILTTRIRLKNSVSRAREDENNDECGIFIDLFRIENTFDNVILRDLHGILCMGMGFLLSCRNFYKNRNLMLELSKDDKKSRRTFLVKIRIGRLLKFLSVRRWAMLTQKCYSLCKKDDSKYVTVPSGRKHFFGEMRLRKDFVETEKCYFEGHLWKIPKNYDAYLKSMYGNYMKIPKIKNREEHVLLELKFPEE